MLLQLLDLPVLRKGGKPVVGDVEFESARQRERAQAMLGRERRAGPTELCVEESVVERGVVGDDRGAVEDSGQFTGDVLESR